MIAARNLPSRQKPMIDAKKTKGTDILPVTFIITKANLKSGLH